MSRTTELVLGIIGGVIGFGGAFFALFFGALDAEFTGNESVLNSGAAAFWFSALAIIGAIVVKFWAKIGGALMALSGLALLWNIGLFGVLPALLLIAAGMMGIFRKGKRQVEEKAA
ncbi:hypothetical protein [Desmospora activa]|uniref:DUF4064 domain-containing protein n=1 Tax=Desmospora activa DSM 45169 TaxID=1121389 RepID=A0A2T4Z929_9BACL|nr:hypothetical protein [Desmospora activa]PTM58402.1 hypothetical protein C8J48_0985 [Desmospora activa DSM 45169]